MQALYDVPAPAKLNLFLHVVGKRPDGYHLLQSLFVLIDWADTLHFERRHDGKLQRHDRGEALPADDLCLRAARLLQQYSGCPLGVDIHIEKRLPSGAGMGGGSSDAASTLLALNRLWGLDLPRSELLQLGLKLGADVPFFIGGQHAFVQGIGEDLIPLDLPECLRFAVIKPQASISTQEIFSSKFLQRSKPAAIVAVFPDHDSEANKLTNNQIDCNTEVLRLDAKGRDATLALLCSGYGRNDLQPPAEAACPDVVQALTYLQEHFGNSRMTGSGSAVFARVNREVDIVDPSMATHLKDFPSEWAGRICRSLDRHPLHGWARD